jgi:hypothetical protein
MPMKLAYTDETVTIRVEIKRHEAYAFSQFLKRVGHIDYRVLAYDDEDAWNMMWAGNRIQEALADKGFAPR